MSKIDSSNKGKPLFLDIGNTAIKGVYRDQANWEVIPSEGIKKASDLLQWIDEHPGEFSEIIVSSVRKEVAEAIQHEINKVPVRFFKSTDIPPDYLDYETPDTLGIDRFLACFGAVTHTNKAVVVIDAGTATTIDFMSAEEVFCGGLIAPGFSSFVNLLHQKAPALPAVENDLPKNWPGKSTRDSLKWGQAGFYKFSIEQSLKMFEEEFGDFELFLTGGDAITIEALLEGKGKIRPYLIFDGMERLYKKKF